MKTLQQHLTQYAAYHRDRRNIATHLIGIPVIVCAVAVLLSRVTLPLGGHDWPLSLPLVLGLGVFYLRLHLGLGLLMGALLAGAFALGQWAAALPPATWLALGLGAFAGGWVLQFVGHAFEGRKPAFVDDLMGLAVGPLFVVVEALFMLGLMRGLRDDIEAQLGHPAH